jgi:hypothetical protein
MAVVLCVTLAGCFSSHHTPRRPGTLSLQMRDGSLKYVRDGRTYSAGLFGDLDQAVAGNPAAVAAAHTYQRRVGPGLLIALAGMFCAEGILLYTRSEVDDDPTYEPPTALIATAIGCAAVATGAMIVGLSGAPYQWDAINIFNDGVDVTHAAPQLPQRRPPITPLTSP